MHAEVKLFYFWQNSSIFRLTPYLAIPCVLSFRYLIVLMPCFSTFPYSSVSSVALPNCSSVLSCPCPEVLLFSTVPLSHYPTVPFSYSTIPLFSVLLSCSCRPSLSTSSAVLSPCPATSPSLEALGDADCSRFSVCK